MVSGTGVELNAGFGFGGRLGHNAIIPGVAQGVGVAVLIAVTADSAGVRGVALGRAGGRRDGGLVIVGRLGDRHIKVEGAVGGGLPGVATRAGGRAGGSFGNRVVIVCGAQLRQSNRGLRVAARAGARQHTRSRNRRRHCNSIAVIVPASANVLPMCIERVIGRCGNRCRGCDLASS